MILLIAKFLAFILFCLASAYVAVVGVNGTGIKSVYVVTALILIIVMWMP